MPQNIDNKISKLKKATTKHGLNLLLRQIRFLKCQRNAFKTSKKYISQFKKKKTFLFQRNTHQIFIKIVKRDDRGWLHFSLEGTAFFRLSLTHSARLLPDASRLKLNMNRGKISAGANCQLVLLHIPAAAGDKPSVLQPTPAEILLHPLSC